MKALTKYTHTDKTELCVINIDNITHMYYSKNELGTTIEFIGGTTMRVEEEMTEILTIWQKLK